jgi:hypothetical protein
MDTLRWKTITAKQRGELWARDFLGEDTWKRWKQDLDYLLAFRKTVKGKPCELQRLQLDLHNGSIKFYNNVLYSGVTKEN